MPGGRGGALARSSASSSFEQIGHFAVIRLWRQNSDVIVLIQTHPADRTASAPSVWAMSAGTG
jgi:hypothetical protein